MIDSLKASLSTGAAWLSGTVKTYPKVEKTYTVFKENVGTPAWNLGSKVVGFTAPYFNPVKDSFIKKATEHRYWTIGIVGALALGLVHALYNNYTRQP